MMAINIKVAIQINRHYNLYDITEIRDTNGFALQLQKKNVSIKFGNERNLLWSAATDPKSVGTLQIFQSDLDIHYLNY